MTVAVVGAAEAGAVLTSVGVVVEVGVEVVVGVIGLNLSWWVW